MEEQGQLRAQALLGEPLTSLLPAGGTGSPGPSGFGMALAFITSLSFFSWPGRQSAEKQGGCLSALSFWDASHDALCPSPHLSFPKSDQDLGW